MSRTITSFWGTFVNCGSKTFKNIYLTLKNYIWLKKLTNDRLFNSCCLITSDQGSLTEGKGSVPLTSLYQLADFSIENFIYFPIIEQVTLSAWLYLNEEVNCTEPSTLVSVPYSDKDWKVFIRRTPDKQSTQSPCQKHRNLRKKRKHFIQN
jgi:hypothetical protein